MATVKKNGKWYIHGKIKKDNGSYYNYNKLARGCRTKKEAKEYEQLFCIQYQDIQASARYMTFQELSKEYMNTLVNIKGATLRTYQDKVDKINKVIGDKKINLITKDTLQKYIRSLESKYASEYVSKFYYIIRSVFNYGMVEKPETKILFIFLYYMGTRKGETLALQWKDIDFNNDIVRINKTVTNKIKG